MIMDSLHPLDPNLTVEVKGSDISGGAQTKRLVGRSFRWLGFPSACDKSRTSHMGMDEVALGLKETGRAALRLLDLLPG
jgi:hypothetical protein